MLQMDSTQVRIRIRNLQALIKARDPLHLQLDHSKMDRNHTNVTTVGHSYRQCLCQGGINWRSLSGAELPPKEEKGSKANTEQ